MNRLTTLYKDILESAGLSVDNDSVVCLPTPAEDVPTIIDGKFLVLPTDDILRNPNWEDTIAFHPLSENVVRGESEVLKKLREILLTRATNVLTEVTSQLIHIASNTSMHKSLSPTQSEFLSHLPEADKKMVDTYLKMIASSSPVGANRFISMYLKRGGTHDGVKYNRLCVVDLPVLNADEDERSIFGVKMRIKDLSSIRDLITYTLPGDYTCGSKSQTAPYFQALLMSYIALMEDLNKVVKLFKKIFQNGDDLITDLSWKAEITCLSDMRDLIPILDGNQGTAVKGATEEPKEVELKPATRTVQRTAGNNQVQRPVANQPAPVTKSNDGTISWQDIQRTTQPQGQYPPQPAYARGYHQPAPVDPNGGTSAGRARVQQSQYHGGYQQRPQQQYGGYGGNYNPHQGGGFTPV